MPTRPFLVIERSTEHSAVLFRASYVNMPLLAVENLGITQKALCSFCLQGRTCCYPQKNPRSTQSFCSTLTSAFTARKGIIAQNVTQSVSVKPYKRTRTSNSMMHGGVAGNLFRRVFGLLTLMRAINVNGKKRNHVCHYQDQNTTDQPTFTISRFQNTNSMVCSMFTARKTRQTQCRTWSKSSMFRATFNRLEGPDIHHPQMAQTLCNPPPLDTVCAAA